MLWNKALSAPKNDKKIRCYIAEAPRHPIFPLQRYSMSFECRQKNLTKKVLLIWNYIIKLELYSLGIMVC